MAVESCKLLMPGIIDNKKRNIEYLSIDNRGTFKMVLYKLFWHKGRTCTLRNSIKLLMSFVNQRMVHWTHQVCLSENYSCPIYDITFFL